MSNLNEQQIYQLRQNGLIKELTKRNLSTSGDIDILRTRLTHYCKGFNQQPYEFFAVIDFEATCVAKPPVPPHPYIQEIIEFPIVLIDVAKQRIVESFHSYCQPILQPILSDYCKQLTGMTQEQVNNAPVFVDVFANVERWLNERNLKQKCLFVTDGPSDFNKYLRMQCELARITYPKWAYQWLNIKRTFAEFYSTMPGRIADMLKKLDVPIHGHLHSGLDDATNIGRIVIQLMKDGCVLLPNEFYYQSVGTSRQHPELSTTQSQSSRMICLNCSRSHSEDQRSCVQDVAQRERRSGSHHSNQSTASAKIPSLLDFPLLGTYNRVSKHHSRSLQVPNPGNDMDTT